jgi:hypothetical protein
MGDDMGTGEGAGDSYIGDEGLYDDGGLNDSGGIADCDRAPIGVGFNEIRMNEFRLGTPLEYKVLPGGIGGKGRMIAEILCEEGRWVGCRRVIYGGERLLRPGLRL